MSELHTASRSHCSGRQLSVYEAADLSDGHMAILRREFAKDFAQGSRHHERLAALLDGSDAAAASTGEMRLAA